MKPVLTLIATLTGLCVPSVALARLGVGDPAPPLSIKHWIKGAAVDPSRAKPDEVFVVEFWATWCAPCVRGIPHMSELQDRFKDKGVTFIGISAEKKSKVEKFLENGFDARMRYTVAVDDRRRTSKNWMAAAGRNGIPCAFVVKGGKIRWIGHPTAEPLDLKVAELCGDAAYAAYKKKRDSIEQALMKAARAKKWEAVLEAFDRLLELDPDRIEVLLAKYHLLITKLDKPEAASTFGHSIVARLENVDHLNRLAWEILENKDFEASRDVKLAVAAVEKAMKLSEEKSPRVIDTYALALAASGNLAGAIKWQAKAIQLCPDQDEGMKRKLERRLKDFEKQAKGA